MQRIPFNTEMKKAHGIPWNNYSSTCSLTVLVSAVKKVIKNVSENEQLVKKMLRTKTIKG